MRKKFLAQIVLAVLVTTFGLTGCKNKNAKGSNSSGLGSDTVPPLGGPGSDVTSANGVRPDNLSGDLPHGQFATVYFDFDSARVRPSEESKVEAVAAYLKANPGKLVVEGYCDERGTAEYNRALGEKRALAAREELVKLGVDGSRITTISYGSEKAADPGHDEAAWSKNRRDEFAVVNQ